MYVNPFWCGVLVTLIVEIMIFIIGAIISAHNDSEGDGDHGTTPKDS